MFSQIANENKCNETIHLLHFKIFHFTRIYVKNLMVIVPKCFTDKIYITY